MKFLANENLPRHTVEALRQAGHDVRWAHVDMRGAPDTAILQCAIRENRVLLTQDKDFGELAFRQQLPAVSGILLFRIAATDPEIMTARVLAVIHSRTDWIGHFSVIDATTVRMRPLPNRTQSN